MGLSLAPLGWMATLPVMGYVVGGALSTGWWPKPGGRWGAGCRSSWAGGGAVLGLLGRAAVAHQNFWLLVTATLVAGYYSANGQLYRLPPPRLALPAFREKAMSLVLAGGLMGAVVGPNLAAPGTLDQSAPFPGPTSALAVVALLAMAVMALVRFFRLLHPQPWGPMARPDEGRPLGVLLRQPVFMVGSRCGGLRLRRDEPADGRRWPCRCAGLRSRMPRWCWVACDRHVAPGFFTGHLIRRFGTCPSWAWGAAVWVHRHCAVGADLHQFLAALLLLGVGWNFCSRAAPRLAMRAYRPAERPAQAAINFGVFCHDGLHLVCLGSAGHHPGLGHAQPGFAAAGRPHRAGGWHGWAGCGATRHGQIELTA